MPRSLIRGQNRPIKEYFSFSFKAIFVSSLFCFAAVFFNATLVLAATNQGRIWSAGFELNSIANDVEIEASGGTGTLAIVTSPVRSGTYALETSRSGTAVASWVRYRFAEANSNGPFYVRAYLRVADYPDATQNIIVFDSTGGTDRAGIRLTNTGTLQLMDLDGTVTQIGSDSAALSLNTWYRVEILYDASAGLSSIALTGRLDGTTFASSAAVVNSAAVGRVSFGGVNGAANYTYYWDDLAINTATWPGAGQIVLLRPNAAGDNTGWAIGAGTGANYEQVDEIAPDDITTYLQEATATGLVTDDYNVQSASSVITAGSTISVVQVGVRGGGNGTTARTVVIRIKASSGGTVEESASVDWSFNGWRTNNEGPNAHNYDLTLYDLPGGSAADWTIAGLDDAQIGIRHDAASTNLVRLSGIWLLVDYLMPTTDTTAPADVSDLAVSTVSAANAGLTWTAPGDDGSSGTATTYDVRYSTSPITAGNFSSASAATGEPTPAVAGSTESLTVTGLSASTLYYFALKTSDEVPNTSNISNVVSTTTLAAGSGPAVKFVIIDPADSTVGTAVTVTVQAQRSDDSVDTGYQNDVTLAASGSATGEGLVDIVNGVGTIQINDAVAETVTLSLSDTEGTGLDVSSTQQVVFSATGGAAAPPSGGSASARVIKVVFSGRAYPDSKIEVLRKDSSAADALYLVVPLETHRVSEDGSFDLSLGALLTQEYFFALRAEDKDGRKTNILAFSVDLGTSDTLEVKDILMPPTIGFGKMRIASGDTLKIVGYATPGRRTEIEIDGKIISSVQANGSGFYSFTAAVSEFTVGNHYVRARQIDQSDKKSEFSGARTFQVSQLALPKADLDKDDRVTITDWSIFLFRWGSADENLRLSIDLDDDGQVGIKDFSIFLGTLSL